jgi:hypothetical protein
MLLSTFFADLGMSVSGTESYYDVVNAQQEDLLESLAAFIGSQVTVGRYESAQSLVSLASKHGFPLVTVMDIVNAALLPGMIQAFAVHESTTQTGSYRIQKKDTYPQIL